MCSKRIVVTCLIAAVCCLFSGCSDQTILPEPMHPRKQVVLTQALTFEVTLVDGMGRAVGTEGHEVWDAEMAWQIDDMIETAPDLVDGRTWDRPTLEAIRALIEDLPSRSAAAAINRSPADSVTWGELKRIYRPKPLKPEG